MTVAARVGPELLAVRGARRGVPTAKPVPLDAFGRCAAFDDATMVEDEDEISGEHRGEAVGDHQGGAAVEERPECGFG